MTLLEVQGLTKDYGEGRGAFDISFQLNPGEMVGFIGPNGAGKSTTLSMSTGFLVPDKGTILVEGKETDWLRIHSYFPAIGVLPSEVAFDPRLRPIDIFEETELLTGIKRLDRAKEMAQDLELDLKKPFGELSLGNKKKVGIINCLFPQPKIVILDEPTSGLDPLIQQKTLQYMQEITKQGGAVLLSSHVLSEVQAYCKRLIMVKNGHIVFQDSTQAILDKMHRLFRFKDLPEHISKMLHSTFAEAHWVKNAGEELLYTPNPAEVLPVLAQLNYTDFYLERPSLEEMFLEYYR